MNKNPLLIYGPLAIIGIFLIIASLAPSISENFGLLSQKKQGQESKANFDSLGGQLNVSPIVATQEESITLTAKNVVSKDGNRIDNVRYYLINPNLASDHNWGDPDWCSNDKCEPGAIITYNISQSSNPGNDYKIIWDGNTKSSESEQKDRSLSSKNIPPGKYEIGLRVEDVYGNVNGSADTPITIEITEEIEEVDSDGDGFSNKIEYSMGTDPYANCARDKNHDAWPPDYNNDRIVNMEDAYSIRPHFNSKEGDSNYSKRYDIYPDGKNDMSDVLGLGRYWKETCTAADPPPLTINAPSDTVCPTNNWSLEMNVGGINTGNYQVNSISTISNRIILTGILQDYGIAPIAGTKLFIREIDLINNIDTNWYQVFDNSQNSTILIHENGSLNLYAFGHSTTKRSVYTSTYIGEKSWTPWLNTDFSIGHAGPYSIVYQENVYRINRFLDSYFLEICNTSIPSSTTIPIPTTLPTATPSGSATSSATPTTNSPGIPIVPVGPTIGNTSAPIEFWTYSSEPVGLPVYYLVDFGDNTFSSSYLKWIPDTFTFNHSYLETGTYDIRVKAISTEDEFQSAWSQSLTIEITGPQVTCTTITNQGNPSNKLDVTFIAAEYSADEMQSGLFTNHVNTKIEQILNFTPFRENSEKINFHKIDIADFTTTSYLTSQAVKLLSNICPTDQIVILNNKGSNAWAKAGIVEMPPTGWDFGTIAHELGHSFGELADEYILRDGRQPWTTINCSLSPTNPPWIGYPGTGAYSGCTHIDWFRPSENSLMRTMQSRIDAFDPWNIKILKDKFDQYD